MRYLARKSQNGSVVVVMIVLVVVLVGLASAGIFAIRRNQPPAGLSQVVLSKPAKPISIGSFEILDYKNPTDIADVYLSYHRNATPELAISKAERRFGVLTPYLDQENGYKVEVLDSKKKVLHVQTFVVPNEAPDTNDLLNGKDQVHQVTFDNVDFFLKVPALPEAKSLRLVDPKGKELAIKELPTPDKKPPQNMLNMIEFLQNAYISFVQPVYAQASEDRCSKTKKDLCVVSLKVSPDNVSVGDKVTISWEVTGVGAKGAIALNSQDKALNRYVESKDSKEFSPFVAKPTVITITADDGEGNRFVSSPITLNVKDKPKKTYNILFVGNRYPTNGMKQFDADAIRIRNYIVAHEPFKSRANDLRFYAIDNLATDFKFVRNQKDPHRYESYDTQALNTFLSQYQVGYNYIIILDDNLGPAQFISFTPPLTVFTNDNTGNYEGVSLWHIGRQLDLAFEYTSLDENGKPAIDDKPTGKAHRNCWAGTPRSVGAEWQQLYGPTFYPGCEYDNWTRTSDSSVMKDVHDLHFNQASLNIMNARLNQLLK